MTKSFAAYCLAASVLVNCSPSFASIEFDQDVTPDVIFGTGNTNGGFTTDRSNGVELGLRAKVRFAMPLNQFNSNGDGTYNHLAGNDAGRALWSFEWSINTSWDGTKALRTLRDLRYEMRIDFDSSASTSFLVFDPINDANPVTGYWDHAIGDQFTANGNGLVADNQALYNVAIAAKNVAQNSWRMDFFPLSFNPNAGGLYTIELAAFEKTSTDPSPFALTSILVIVESSLVPEPLSCLVWVGLIGGALIPARRCSRS